MEMLYVHVEECSHKQLLPNAILNLKFVFLTL